jgi:putative ATP-dependent endonuclease of the OLD family
MQLKSVEISNYRNLDGIKITFDRQINFLVGENELGKSNLLDLFDILFSGYRFSQDDFANKNSPIKINFSFYLSEAERGFFEDQFTPDNKGCVTIHSIQEAPEPDEEIQFYWQEHESQTPLTIKSYLFRNINYIYYDSLKTPKDELTFHKGRGSGRFLSYLINEFAGDDIQSNVEQAMEHVVAEITSFFKLVKPLKQHGLGLYTDKENPTDFASRVLKLSGNNGFDFQKSGYGAQFSTLLILTILERLAHIKQSKKIKYIQEKREYLTAAEYKVFSELRLRNKAIETLLQSATREEGGNYYIDLEKLTTEAKEELGDDILTHIKVRNKASLILGLDEPEIHLHPYMQRSLIKYINTLTQNQDSDFLLLLKKYFNIDAIEGQILMVSHSPAAILNDYKKIVRFYKGSTVEVASGVSVDLPENIEKHLLLHFPYIKEAFFSKCVVLVEGETEAGAIPLWGNKIVGDLDDHGIVVIKVGGKGSIPPTAALLKHFRIPNVSIKDKDNDNDTKAQYTSVDGLRTTGFRDFEEELFESIKARNGNVDLLFDFLDGYGKQGLDKTYGKKEDLIEVAKAYKIDKTWDLTKERYTFTEAREKANLDLIKAMFLYWLKKFGKGIIFGRAIGQSVPPEFIPPVYQQLFKDALIKAK